MRLKLTSNGDASTAKLTIDGQDVTRYTDEVIITVSAEGGVCTAITSNVRYVLEAVDVDIETPIGFETRSARDEAE